MDFYKNLLPIKRTIPDVLADETCFADLPGDWHIVVADISNSTQAVGAGRHPDVNLVAAGCLIVALNVSKSLNVEIPYFFGGDGGTVLVPDQILQPVIEGLHAHQLNSLKNFSMELRVGSISMETIKKAGYVVKLAKVEESPGFNKSILTGNGLRYAEQLIKKSFQPDEAAVKKALLGFDPDNLNLEGMECKWDKVRPPASELEVVCYLIEAVEEQKQSSLYSEVLNKLEEIYGGLEKRHPITVNMLKFKNNLKKLQREMMARYSKWKPFYFLKTWLRSLAAKVYFKLNLKVDNLRANDYLLQLIAFSEILTIDGRINTIVSGTRQNRIAFLEYLQQKELKHTLVYGHYVSSASIMTCYVENLNNKHIHFIDGADGGYTEAAKELKPKLSALPGFVIK